MASRNILEIDLIVTNIESVPKHRESVGHDLKNLWEILYSYKLIGAMKQYRYKQNGPLNKKNRPPFKW